MASKVRVQQQHARDSTRALVMYWNAYLYCVYALVGGAISIRDPYICAVSRVCANESHAVFSRARCLCSKNVAIGFTLA